MKTMEGKSELQRQGLLPKTTTQLLRDTLAETEEKVKLLKDALTKLLDEVEVALDDYTIYSNYNFKPDEHVTLNIAKAWDNALQTLVRCCGSRNVNNPDTL